MKSTAEEWRFGYLLPHINFSAPIENEFVALVPDSDQRLAGLAASQEAIDALVTRLHDQFGEPVKPSALLIHKDAPAAVDFYALLCFRNAISISSERKRCHVRVRCLIRYFLHKHAQLQAASATAHLRGALLR